MAISFDTIPTNLLVPGNYTEVSGRRASSPTPVLPRRLVVIGQKLTAGSATAGVPFRVFSNGDAESKAGVGSQLAEMLIVAKARNRFVEMWGIALADDGAAVAAAATVTIGGTATVDGTLAVYVAPYWAAGVLRGRYTVKVTATTAAAVVATALAAAINADPYRQVQAVAVAAVVTLTARNAGVLGNSLSVQHSYFDGEALPTGLTCATTAFTTGATNPVIATAVAALGDQHTTHLVNPYVDATNLTTVETEMVRRWGGTVQRECFAFAAQRGNLSTLTTLGDGRNSPFHAIFGVGLSPTPPYIAAAEVAAIDAGMDHPGRPLRTRPIDCMVAPKPGDEFEGDERQQLLAEGISTYTVDPSGKCMMERLVSTYQVDALGSPDSKYRDRQVAGLLFAIRWDWRTYIGGKYPDYMHAADGSTYDPGLAIITPSTMKAEFAGRARNVWVKGQGWMENADQFEDDIVIERTEDGMDMVGVPDLINRLHITKTRFDFLR